MTAPDADLLRRAMALLARREYARAELRRRLLPIAAGREAALDALLAQLEARGWLSDERFAEQLVHVRSARFGARRIIDELRQKGVGEEVIAAHQQELRAQEPARAAAALHKKYGSLASDRAGRARQMRFLQSRGFGMDVILRVMRADPDEWPAGEDL